MWEDEAMMPRGMFCNGYLTINGEKMSKSTGNFLSLRDCVKQFGVDATRITLADAGDNLDDANFETPSADAYILKLYTLEKWISEKIKKTIPEGNLDFSTHKNFDLWDNIFMNAMNNAINNATKNYDEIKYKNVLKFGMFELLSIKEDYLIAKGGNMNPYVLMRYIAIQLVILNPIIPHFSQFCWNTHVYPILKNSTNFGEEVQESLCKQAWPTASGAFDKIAAERLSYLKDLKGRVSTGL
jgi:leucyl-tRNA synthetase